MRRLVLLLVVGGAIYGFFALRSGARTSGTGEGGPVDDGGVPDGVLALVPSAGEAPPARHGAQEEPVAVPLRAAIEDRTEQIAKLQAGGVEVLGHVAASLWRGEVVAQELRAAFGEGIRRLRAPALLELIGTGNAFLQYEEGRALSESFLKGLATEPPDIALKLTNRWLEHSMQGPLPEGGPLAREQVDRVYAEHAKLVRRMICNTEDLTRARSHLVGKGDVLERIASQYRREGLRVEAGLLMAVNRIDDARRLKAGQSIKIPTDPVRTVIDKSSFLAAVYLGDTILRMYWIGHGKEDRTPEAVFEIGKKQEKPDWTIHGKVIPYGHPDNVLGDYFVEFRHPSLGGFGAHGTPDPASIGRAESLGCIRMRDQDIAEFFQIVPRGTPVEIRATR